MVPVPEAVAKYRGCVRAVLKTKVTVKIVVNLDRKIFVILSYLALWHFPPHGQDPPARGQGQGRGGGQGGGGAGGGCGWGIGTFWVRGASILEEKKQL